MTDEKFKEEIKSQLEALIGTTWVELLEDAPEVMYAVHDLEATVEQISSLFNLRLNRLIEGLKVVEDVTKKAEKKWKVKWADVIDTFDYDFRDDYEQFMLDVIFDTKKAQLNSIKEQLNVIAPTKGEEGAHG